MSKKKKLPGIYTDSMKLIFPRYALKRMIERGISVADVGEVLRTGEVIERYRRMNLPVISC